MPPRATHCCYACNVCGRLRPDPQISVATFNFAALFGLRAAAFDLTVRYCIDSPECRARATDSNWLRAWIRPQPPVTEKGFSDAGAQTQSR